MSRLVRQWVAAGALVALATPGLAQHETLVTELRACQAIPDNQARLRCYDAALLRVAPGQPQPTATPAPAAATPAVASFGLPAPKPAPEPQQMEGRLAGQFQGWSQGTRLELANGQVWEVVDSSRASYDLDRPAVRLKRGVLGGYFMEIEGVSATPRVRRLR